MWTKTSIIRQPSFNYTLNKEQSLTEGMRTFPRNDFQKTIQRTLVQLRVSHPTSLDNVDWIGCCGCNQATDNGGAASKTEKQRNVR